MVGRLAAEAKVIDRACTLSPSATAIAMAQVAIFAVLRVGASAAIRNMGISLWGHRVYDDLAPTDCPIGESPFCRELLLIRSELDQVGPQPRRRREPRRLRAVMARRAAVL